MKKGTEWLVSDRHCAGCIYYGYLAASAHQFGRCCDYTLKTGHLRQGVTAECRVRKTEQQVQ